MDIKDRGLYVYDIETLKACFTYTDINVDTLEVNQFVLHEDQWELEQLIIHLKANCKAMIGFNSLHFDYPVLHYMIKNYNKFMTYPRSMVITDIYREVQRIISDHNPFGTAIKPKEVLIPQLDLFRLWHFNNHARMQSLKGLEIAMKFSNVQDMPIHHDQEVINKDDIKDILSYNFNDVKATLEFYKKSLEKINLRKDLRKTYGIECYNYPDSKIGEELTLKLYCERTGLDYWETKKLRTERLEIALNDCIFDYIEFKTDIFKDFLENLRKQVIMEMKGEFSKTIIFKGQKYEFGLGGLHLCCKPGIYTSDKEWIILDLDVGSMYPNIAVQNKLFPAHLGIEFCEVYEDIVKQRIAAKKAGDLVISDALKLSLNSVFGKSNDKYSFLFDKKYTVQTTLNGQLMLAMLCEDLNIEIPDLQMLQCNTDGSTIRIKREYIDLYYKICKAWEDKTKLQLEFVEYDKMIIRDVNNYLSVTTTGKVKEKGIFETKKDWHKDNSFMIIPIALREFFVNEIPVEETIRKHTDIYDFCGRQKFKGKDFGVIRYIKDGKIIEEKQQKNVRYYISTNGSSFIKHFAKGTTQIIHVDYSVTVFNKYIEKSMNDYNIDYQFYIQECYKEIDLIIKKQLKMNFNAN